MIVKIFNAQLLADGMKRPPKGKREYVVQLRNTYVHVRKIIIDGEEAKIGKKDMLVLEASSVHFIEEKFDKKRYVLVYKEARLTTKENSMKEAIKNALDDAQYLVTWVVRPPE